MLRAGIKQILGTPNGASWSQVHHFLPDEKIKRKKRGELILLASLGKISGDYDSVSLGREVISRFHEEYFGNLEGKPMESLRNALTKVGQEKSQYFEHPEEISLLALIVWEDIIYLGVRHQGKILLRRHGKTATLIEGQSNKVKVASGFLEKGDLFFLGTKDLFEKIPQGMVSASLSTEDLEAIGEVLTPVVHARERQGSLAAVAVKIVDSPSFFKKPKAAPLEEGFQKKPSSFKKAGKILLHLRKKARVMIKKIPSFRNLTRFRFKTSALTVALGFILLLGVSVFFGWRKRVDQQQKKRIGELSIMIEENLKTAAAIRGLDPDNTIKVLGEAEGLIAELKELDSVKADSFQVRLSSISSGLTGEAIEPQMYYDLNLVSEEVVVQDVSRSGREVTILDKEQKKPISLNLEDKTGKILFGGEDLADKEILVSSGNRIYLIGDNVGWFEDRKVKTVAELDEEDKIVAASGWLGNLYLLDIENNQVWKYSSTSDGLGRKKAWLRDSLSLGAAVDMTIDGHIWTLLDNGRIYKFLSGRKDKFEQKLPSGIGSARFLTVAQEGEKVAFWDEEKKTVWIFDKEGNFISRVPVELDGVGDLILSSKGDRVFLFSKDKIYFLEI